MPAPVHPAQNLAERWADRLRADDLKHLRAIAQLGSARQRFAVPFPGDPAANIFGFLRFERVYDGDPVALFGQDAKAMASSRLVITRAVRDGQGGWTPGDVVFSARMSDRAITDLVLNSNQGQAAAAMTVERLGNCTLPAYVPGPKAADLAMAGDRAKARDKMANGLKTLADAVALGGSAKARATAAAALKTARSIAADLEGVEFLLDRRMDTLAKRRVDLVSEAAHAALHADKVADAMAQPRLAPPEQEPFDPERLRFAHPLLDAALAPMTDTERSIVCTALGFEMAQALGTPLDEAQPVTEWPSGQKLAGLRLSEEAKKRIESYDALARAAIHKDRTLDPRTASLGLIQSQGWHGEMHTSLPTQNDRVCMLRIESAWEEGFYGAAQLRSTHTPYLEVLLSPDDMMMALRGHPTGAMTPCTFRALACVHLPSERRGTLTDGQKVGRMAKTRAARSEGVTNLLAALDALEAHLDAHVPGNAWKDEAKLLMDVAMGALSGYHDAVDIEGFSKGTQDLQTMVGAMVSEEIRAIGAVLPEGALPRLLGKG